MGKQAHQEIDVRARTFALLKQCVPYAAAGWMITLHLGASLVSVNQILGRTAEPE